MSVNKSLFGFKVHSSETKEDLKERLSSKAVALVLTAVSPSMADCAFGSWVYPDVSLWATETDAVSFFTTLSPDPTQCTPNASFQQDEPRRVLNCLQE